MAVTGVRGAAQSSPARNRTNAAWLRERITELRDARQRAAAYGDRALTDDEVCERLRAILAGEEPQQ